MFIYSMHHFYITINSIMHLFYYLLGASSYKCSMDLYVMDAVDVRTTEGVHMSVMLIAAVDVMQRHL